MPLRPIVEVARDLGVADDLLYRLMAEGKLARYRREFDRRTYVDEEQARTALGFELVRGPAPEQPGKIRPLRDVAKDWGWSTDTIQRLIRAGLVARYRRRGDALTYVDEEQVRAAKGWRRVSGPPPE